MSRKYPNPKRKNRDKKHEAYILISQLYHFLQSHPNNVFFRKLRGIKTGDYMEGDEEIRLDYRKEIIPTLIHEFIHHLHPHMCETLVREKERQIMAAISPRQCINVLRALGSCVQTSKN